MDLLIPLVALAGLALPIMAIIALVMAIGARERIRLIERRLAGLESALAAGAMPRAAPATEAPGARPQPPPEPIAQTGAEAIVPPEPAEPSPGGAPLTVPEMPAIEPSFEERFGTRWAVRIGGLALALGGIFLARYAIEAGVIGPIALGALLALCLVAAGEWTRRQEALVSYARVPSAHIPGVLTAAGTMVAYATVYAAYGVYGFLSPAAAFVLLGLVALVTLAAALLHGPALAALGLVGAFLTPMLVATDVPNYWALYVASEAQSPFSAIHSDRTHEQWKQAWRSH